MVHLIYIYRGNYDSSLLSALVVDQKNSFLHTSFDVILLLLRERLTDRTRDHREYEISKKKNCLALVSDNYEPNTPALFRHFPRGPFTPKFALLVCKLCTMGQLTAAQQLSRLIYVLLEHLRIFKIFQHIILKFIGYSKT